MKRNLLITCFFINLLCIPLQQLLAQGNNCQNADPFCTDSGASFPAGVNTGTAQGGNNYGCLQTQPNPAWYYLKILDPGAIHIQETNSSDTDIDFALWGPYNDLPDALDQCGNLPAPIDCSYSPQANEQIDIPNSSQQGDVFLLLLTNYGNSPTDVFANQLNEAAGGPGSTDCSIVTNCPPVNATAAANSPVCTGGAINLVGTLDITAPAGTTYSWTGPNGFTANQPNATVNNATPANSGTYYFTATAPNGCQSTIGQVTVIVGQPVAVPSSNAPLCPGQQLQLFGNYNPSILTGVTFTWTTPTGATSSQQNPIVNNPVAGNYTLVVNYNGCQSNPVSVNVTIASISPNLQSQNPSCSNPPFDGAVQVNPAGGGSPYSYTWSANAGVSNTTDNTASQLGAGTYTVTITASSGCTAVASATLQTPPPLSLIAATQNPACFNGTNGGANIIASGGAGGYSYLWSNGATNNPTGNLSAGTYTVTVSDSGGCTASTAVTLNNPANFSVNIAPTNPNCAGTATGAANANVTPAGSYTYSWSNGATTNPANNIAAGNISVTVTNVNGCTNTATNTLTNPTQLSVSVTTQAATCLGANNGGIQATPSGGTSPYTFAWSAPISSTNFQVGNLLAGTYTVTVTDTRGCTTTASATISQPTQVVASINGISPTCAGGTNGFTSATASGGTAPYAFSWSNGINGANNINVGANTYTVTITDSNNCTATASTTLNNPPAITASITPSNPLCNGANTGAATASSNGAAPLSFLWSNGDTGNTADNLLAGNISVTVTDANTCSATANGTIAEPTPISANVTTTDATCNGAANGTATVTASGGTGSLTYAWSNGDAGTTADNLNIGNISVTITDANACSATANGTIAEPTPINANVTTTDATCNGAANGTATVTASGGTGSLTFAWSNGDAATTADNLNVGNISVTVTDANACSATANGTIAEPTPINANVTTTDATCNGAANGTATVTASGGTGSLTFAWSNGDAGTTADNLNVGNISVTVTDANACSATANGTIAEPTPINANVTTTDATCNGAANGTATVTASGGTGTLTYAWSNGDAGTTADNLNVGNISVTVTDANTCSATANGTIAEPTPINANVTTTDATCNGAANGTATVTASGGTGSLTFAWSNGDAATTADNLNVGNISVTVTDANACSATANGTIAEPTPINANVTTTDATCNGAANGTATVTASGGTGSLTFAWSNGDTATTADNLNVGNISVTVTDANACSATANGTIAEPTPINANVTTTDATCNGAANGTATVTASGGTGSLTFAWSNGDAATTADNLNVGNISVTVTDANACSATANGTIAEPTALIVNITPATSTCGQSNGSATASVSGGNPTYTYQWSGGNSNNNSVTALASGGYVLTVTDSNGCSITQTFDIVDAGAPTIAVNTVIDATCGNANGSANLTASGGQGALTYTWSPAIAGSNDGVVNNVAADNYTLTVEDSSGCQAVETITINDTPSPQLSVIDTQNASCGDDNGSATVAVTTGGTGNFTYTWSNPSLNDNPTPTNLAAGMYSVTVTDDEGCTDTASFTLTNTLPPILSLNNSIDAACGQANGAIDVTVTDGTTPFDFAWSANANSATTEDLSSVSGGTYTVTVTDAFNCSTISSFSIQNLAAPNISIIALQDASCGDANGSVTVASSGGTGTTNFTWGNSQNGATLSNLSTATYTVTATDANGCTDTEIVVIGDTPLPELTIQANNTATCSEANGSVTLSTTNGTGNMTYTWQGLSTTGPTATGLAQGNYQVTVTDAASCTDTITVTVDDAPSPIVSNITPTSSTCGNANGQITVVATGGSALSYAWSAVAVGNSANANNLAANTYTVTVSDANNCTATASTIVDDIAGPNLQVTNITPDFCNQSNGSISVNATNGTPIYNYIWSNTSIGNTDSPSNLAQGNYSVTVTDSNQCTATLMATINPTAGPTLAATDVQDAACGQNTGSISVTPSGGSGTFSYQWTNDVASNNSAINLLAGIYTITITDGNNCTATTTATVNDLAAPILTVNNSTNTTCGLSNGVLSVSVNGGVGGYIFQWSHDISVVGNTANGLSATTYTITVTDINNCSATTSATLTDSPAQTLSEGTIVNANCGQSNGSAQVLVDGGTTPYNYLWDNGQTNATATNLAAGTYTITVTDNNQCTAVLTLAITNLGAPTITVNNVTASTCGNSNGAIDISASGGTGTLSYTWDNQAITEDINNIATGTYGVTVTDSGNCQAVEVIVIDDNPSPTLILTGMTPASCGQNDGSLTVAPSGGSGSIDYLWSSSPAQNTPTATNLATGIYTVTITDDNNCTATLSATVDPADGPSVILNQTTNATCGQANGSVSVTASGGEAPLSYSWSNDNGLNSPSNINLATGSYTVTVTDNNGCTISLLVEVPTENGPSVTISGVTDATCGESNGELVASGSGGVLPYTYSWSNDINNNSPTDTNLAVGTYTVTITDNNNCVATTSGTISMANGPTINIDSVTPETCGLDNGAINITINGGLEPYTIVWNNGANSVNINNLDCNNTYIVTVTDANGCTQTTEVSVACFESPTVALDTLVATTCGDDNGQISVVPTGGIGQIDYQWSGGIATNASQINNLSPNTYTVTITDGNGCTATTSGTIDPSSSPVLSEGAIVAAHCGLADGSASTNVVNGTSPYNFVWDNTPQTTPTITNVSAGSYQVTVTDAVGCTDELVLTVGNADGQTGVVVDGQSLCGVAEGSLTVNVNGGIAPYSYNWDTNPVQTDATAINLFPGDYSVTVTDASGCTFVANGIVIGSLPPTVVSCGAVTDNSITFTWTAVTGASGYSVSINNGVAQNVGNITTFTVNDLDEDETVTISVVVLGAPICGNESEPATGSCTTLNPGCPPQPINLNGLITTYCVDNPVVVLNFTPVGGTYSGSGISSNNFNPTTAGVGSHEISYVFVTPDGECSYDTTVTVTVVALPQPDFSSEAGACVGESMTFIYIGSDNIDSYAWNFGGTTAIGEGPHIQSFGSSGTPIVSLSVIDNNGCDNQTSQTVTISQTNATIQAANVNILVGSTTVLNVNANSSGGGVLTYTWSPSDVDCNNANCSSVQIAPIVATTYTVTVTDALGCSATDSETVSVYYENLVVLPNAFSPNDDDINPIFVAKGHNIKETYLQVHDRWGQLVYEKADVTDLNTGWNGKYNDGKRVELGVYVYYAKVIFTDDSEETIKGNVTVIY